MRGKLRQRDVSIHRGEVILVNRAHPLAGQGAPRLREVEGGLPGVWMETRAAHNLEQWLAAAGCRGRILPVSGYRSRSEQEDIYRAALVEHGRAFTEKFVAVPGCSEHETGLAVDLSLADGEINYLTPELPYHGIAARLRLLAGRYGFVERYPFGKEPVTGIGHEPWHFRYVGRPHAGLMAARGLALEEYCELLESHPIDRAPLPFEEDGEAYEVGYLAAGEAEGFLAGPSGEVEMTLSGDNRRGFIAARRVGP